MSCPVCFGGGDPVMRESLNAGIGVLLGVTGLVLAAFARFFVGLARRAREAPDVPVDGRFGGWEPRSWEPAPGSPEPAGHGAPDGGSR